MRACKGLHRELLELGDAQLLERLQRAAFDYFTDFTNPRNGLVADTSRPRSPCSIAVVGFALSAYPVAVERGWIERAAAAARVATTLDFFLNSAQGPQATATGHKGFYYHFLDMQTGQRVWQCELSMVDTALLLAGVLTVQAYFSGPGQEAHVRSVSAALFERVDWRWALNSQQTVWQGWKPECGFLHYGWEGYNEATLLYVLGSAAGSQGLQRPNFSAWTATYQWEHLLGQTVLYSGPLFTHLFSHAWIDYRGIRDQFMRERGSDYFLNTQRTIAVHREYARRNPHRYVGYDADLWGITAGDGPETREAFGYMSRGAPFGPDDGTLAPWAMLATLPFADTWAWQGTRRLLRDHPEVCTEDRFCSGFNLTLGSAGRPWLSAGWYGLDQGLLVLMIENYRSGLIWSISRGHPLFRSGLRAVGFSGGWLES